MKYSMFFYRRSLARAGNEELRRAAEAVVDAAIVCNASQGRYLPLQFEMDSAIDPDCDPESDGQCCLGGLERSATGRSSQVREKLIKSILRSPARTAELFNKS